MFKNFDISSFKKMKPPGDNTFDTSQELKALAKIPFCFPDFEKGLQ